MAVKIPALKQTRSINKDNSSDPGQSQIHIEYMPLDGVQRAITNPKDHDLGEIHKSIRRFGFTSPALLNETTGRLVAGHGRLDALIQQKVRGEPPPKRIIEKNGKWYLPVIRGIAFDTDEEAQAYLIADNQLTVLGGWDDPTLVQSLSDLATQGEQMLAGVGFDTDDLDDLIRKMNAQLDKESAKQESDEQDQVEVQASADELLEKYANVYGDIWQIGPHFLLTGDCRDPLAIQSLLDCAQIDHYDGAFTSPPYAEQRAKRANWYGGIDENSYTEWWLAVQENIAQFLEPQGSFFVNIKPNVVDGARSLYVLDLVTAMCREWGWLLIDEFCWERTGAPGRWHNRFKNGFEPVYQFARTVHCSFYPENVAEDRSGESIHQGGNRSTGNYYNMSHKTVEWEQVLPSNRVPTFGNAIGAMHPAAFPVGLPQFFLRAFSELETTWLDPFAGSGTLGVAANNCHRQALLIELSPRYSAIALERLSIATGQTPEKVGKIQYDRQESPQ